MNGKEMYDKILEDLAELTDLMKVLRPYDGETPAALRKLVRKKAAAVWEGVDLYFPEKEGSEMSESLFREETESSVPAQDGTTEGISGTTFAETDHIYGNPLPETPDIPDRADDRDSKEQPVHPEGGNIPLEELLSRRLTRDLKKAISLNDWFRFKRELFGDNENLMNSTITYLNGLGSFAEADGYIRKAFSWDMDSVAAQDFMNILEKRFS